MALAEGPAWPAGELSMSAGGKKADRRGGGNINDLLRNRWLGLAAASWVESCAGVAYMFSLYSQSFKDNLGYTQTMVDLVGMAKDLGGNVGIVSGFVGDLCPPWVVLAIGAAQNMLGYLATWMALTGRIQNVPFWAVMAMVCIGTNGATFFNTGGLVTCVKNFPSSRGPIVGLLKGFIGLSGALFTQLYLALYAPDHDAFILMTAWFPALIAVLAMPAIHNLPAPAFDPHERKTLFGILVCAVATASFLLGATLVDNYVAVSRGVSLSIAIVAMTALASPAWVAWKQVYGGGWGAVAGYASSADETESEEDDDDEERRLLSPDGSRGHTSRSLRRAGSAEASVRLRQRSPPRDSGVDKGSGGGGGVLPLPGGQGSWHEGTTREALVPAVERSAAPKSAAALKPAVGLLLGEPAEGTPAAHRAHVPHVGEDHTLLQAASTVSFWLIYLAMTGASGSGLTAINNLGQFGRSLGYGQNEIGIFVSLMSIWNFLGRVGAGYVSEYFLHESGMPRPAFMVCTQLFMAFGHIVFATALPGSLYLGSVVVGLSYGAQWGLMPAIASEVFGLKYFGTLYNWLTITNPTGSYLLSVCVAGYLYDYEAAKEAAPPAPSGVVPGPPPPGVPKACHGAHCFRETFLIMALACMAAALLSAVLTAITHKYYIDEFARRHAVVVTRVESAEAVGEEGGDRVP